MSTERKMMCLNTKDIVVDEQAQRDVESRRAQFNKIMRNFNPDKVDPLKVAFIDGKYYLMDGQMTMKVLKARNKGNDLKVECLVFYGMTKLDAALFFVHQTDDISKVKAADKLRVLANYGDPESVAIVKLTEMGGLEIAWNGAKGKNAIVAISALTSVFRELEGLEKPEKFISMIRVLKSAYDGNPDAVCQQMLYGLGKFIKTYYGQYDEARLIRKLRENLPKDILRDAQVDRSTGMRKYAVQILQIYNGSLRNPLPNKL